MNGSRKRANDFLKEYFKSTEEEPYMLSVLEETDGLKKELGGVLPAVLDISDGIRGRLMAIEAMRRMMDSVSAVLPETETRVMHGIYRDGLSADELAADLNCERSAVYRVKNRLLDRVGRLLGA